MSTPACCCVRNRRSLQETESGETHAFLYLDPDNLKVVND